MTHFTLGTWASFLIYLLFITIPAAAQTPDNVCLRPAAGSAVTEPPSFRSSGRRLAVDLDFRAFVDVYGLTDYCYASHTGMQSPTLRLRAGDQLTLRLKNGLPASLAATGHIHGAAAQTRKGKDSICQGGPMSAVTTNMHFHGMGLPPTCHQDETLRTLIQPSDPAFEYRIKVPLDQPPGLYWYHPHPHGHTEEQILGGASGALIVEGIERKNPAVAGLPERVLVLRDQKVPGMREADEDAGPGKDLSLNFVPVLYPLYRPTEMPVRPAEREFWRVLNASADSYFDLQIRFGATIQNIQDPQPLELIALDGVATGQSAAASHVKDILLAPGARAEFVATTPPAGVFAQLVTLEYNTGPDGAASPFRVIANVRSRTDAPHASSSMPVSAESVAKFTGLQDLTPVRRRKLYFSEERPSDPAQPPRYFITVEGETPKVFDMNFTHPDITARQGTVEDWIVENRAPEAHAFHIHQLHFQVLERNGATDAEQILRDTIDLPYWSGPGSAYPSVKLRMDFRQKDIAGIFVFHCHILEHEDAGMMGSIQVLPESK